MSLADIVCVTHVAANTTIQAASQRFDISGRQEMESEMNAAPGEQIDGDVEYRPDVNAHGRSLMDVLMPANPPEPKNARVIRLFDTDAAKNDAQPDGAATEPARRDARSGRRASRELRSQSLAAAAGLR
jgi:hypothetical protein